MLGPEIITMELPYDQDWLAFTEFNVLALAPHLDAAGRDRAIDEAYAQWRQSQRRRIVPSLVGPDTR